MTIYVVMKKFSFWMILAWVLAACSPPQTSDAAPSEATQQSPLATPDWLKSGGLAKREVPRSDEEVKLSYAPVVSRVAPSVVNVYSQRVVKSQASVIQDPFFRRFFGGNFGVPRERVEQSLGSGVIVRSDGIVVTNHHVVADATALKVVLNDRREYTAKTLLSDPKADLAILQLENAEGLPSVAIDDSEDLAVGDLVLALGNPFGVGQTVTSGIISALARSDVGITDYSFFIQTDAAINPGNSGGALVDINGNLIGVNTAIFSRGGGSNGIGFAIPAAMVKRVVDSAIGGERFVERPWFGIKGQTVSQDIAQSLNLDRPQGLLISELYAQGPAVKAGLKRGDVILSIDGQAINDEAALKYRAGVKRPGERVEVVYARNGKRQRVQMEAAALPKTPKSQYRTLDGQQPLAGATVASLSPALADALDLDPFAQGVVIVELGRGSIAARAGFRTGDVIESLNGAAISSAAELNAALTSAETWQLTLIRNGRRLRARF